MNLLVLKTISNFLASLTRVAFFKDWIYEIVILEFVNTLQNQTKPSLLENNRVSKSNSLNMRTYLH